MKRRRRCRIRRWWRLLLILAPLIPTTDTTETTHKDRCMGRVIFATSRYLQDSIYRGPDYPDVVISQNNPPVNYQQVPAAVFDLTAQVRPGHAWDVTSVRVDIEYQTEFAFPLQVFGANTRAALDFIVLTGADEITLGSTLLTTQTASISQVGVSLSEIFNTSFPINWTDSLRLQLNLRFLDPPAPIPPPVQAVSLPRTARFTIKLMGNIE